MLRERGSSTPSPAIVETAREVNGAARGDDPLKKQQSEQQLMAAGKAAVEKIKGASVQDRCVRIVERALALDCASDDARIALANQITGFGRYATDFIERGDFAGVEAAIVRFSRAARDAASIAPPRPPMMPALGGETFFHFGWSSEEQKGLQTILTLPMCGVKLGDHVVDIDEKGVRLASGLSFTRERILAANVPASQVGR